MPLFFLKNLYSIVIPVFNEVNQLPKLLSELKKFSTLGHEIIIVDDGSFDGSSDLLANTKFINLKRSSINQGKGKALKKGLKIAKYDKIIIYDSDFELHPKDIKKLMILSNKNSNICVFANRVNRFQDQIFWDIGNAFFSKLFNLINGTNVRDVLCCAKSFKKEDIDINHLKSKSFDIDVEIASQLAKRCKNISTVEISYKRRGKKGGKKLKILDSIPILYRMIMS